MYVATVIYVAVASTVVSVIAGAVIVVVVIGRPLSAEFPLSVADFRSFMFAAIKVPKENVVEGIRIQVGLSLLRHWEL